ncbi:hypothetical protein D3C81_726800 [compost metagenome]
MVGQVANLRLGVFQLADIASGHQQAGRLVEGDRLNRDLNGEQFAALVASEHFPMMHTALVLQFREQDCALFVVRPNADFVDAVADHFSGAVARQATEAVIDLQVAATVELGDGDGVGAGVECLGEFLFTGFKRSLGPLLLGDVAQGRDAAGQVVDGDQAAGYHAGQRLTVFVVDHHRDIVQGFIANHLLDAPGAFC